MAKQAMAAGDPGARWIMQAWLFYNEKDFWQKPQIQVRRHLTSRRSQKLSLARLGCKYLQCH